MEYIILQPLQTNNEKLNVSIVQRKAELTREEESLILHEAEGPFAGFIIKKMMPIELQQRLLSFDKSDLSFKLNMFMKHATRPEMQQVSVQFYEYEHILFEIKLNY